mmetsp:Transcript_29529/g.45329  ORF Transcript_29529/g.45329 Transcript_29529/m.45329 type:complete len:213 (+) Transcript_29529:4482-5120(+)
MGIDPSVNACAVHDANDSIRKAAVRSADWAKDAFVSFDHCFRFVCAFSSLSLSLSPSSSSPSSSPSSKGSNCSIIKYSASRRARGVVSCVKAMRLIFCQKSLSSTSSKKPSRSKANNKDMAFSWTGGLISIKQSTMRFRNLPIIPSKTETSMPSLEEVLPKGANKAWRDAKRTFGALSFNIQPKYLRYLLVKNISGRCMVISDKDWIHMVRM